MALEFSEYRMARATANGTPQMVQSGELANQSVAIGAANAVSAAFGGTTEIIVISKVDQDCRIAFGAAPVAVTTGAGQTRFLRAGSEYAFMVQPGEKLGVIQA
jgi:hypothetical protein